MVTASLSSVALLLHVFVGLFDHEAALIVGESAALAAGALVLAHLSQALSIGSRRDLVATVRRRSVVRDVVRAIEMDEIEMHYQPQVRLASGEPFAVEALLRWNRSGQLQAPASFLPEVEGSDAIGPLTAHVLELVIAQAGRWRRDGHRLRVSVNLSPANLSDPTLPNTIERLLTTYRVPAEMLTIELTETAVLRHPELTRTILDGVAALGIGISVDDFGTGYSSLIWLRAFPVTEVKIDRAFVATMMEDGDAYVAGVIRLAHDLGLSVVAEGIEDEATLKRLRHLGCDHGQGYLFARPLTPEQLVQWLHHNPGDQWAGPPTEVSIVDDGKSLAEARDRVEHVASDLGYERDAIWDMKVAATEALSGALGHTPAGDRGRIRLELIPDGDELHMEISGSGITHRQNIGSIGHADRLAIMTGLMDEVTLLRRPGNDTMIRLERHP